MLSFTGINISMRDYTMNAVSMNNARSIGNCQDENMCLKSFDFTINVMMKI